MFFYFSFNPKKNYYPKPISWLSKKEAKKFINNKQTNNNNNDQNG